MAVNKVDGPTTIVTFLGIQVDTVRFELTLPPHKLERIVELVRSWQGHRSGWRNNFDSLLGYLSHACATIIQQGCVFFRHLYDIQARTRSPYHHVHLNAKARADLLWWEHFLQTWSGTMVFRQPPIPTVHVYTDSSGSFGAGSVWAPYLYFQLQWPTTRSTVDIVIKDIVIKSHWLSWRHSGAGIGTIRTFVFTLTMKR